MEGYPVMKRAVFLSVVFCAIAALAGPPIWAACSGPTALGHQINSGLFCDDSTFVQAFIYEIGAPLSDNSGRLRVACRYTGATDPGLGSDCLGSGSGVPNDGQIDFETDPFLNQWVGCPAPPGAIPVRIAAVVVDSKGQSLILSVSGHDATLGYQFEGAHPYDPATGAIGMLSCGTTSGRPKILTYSLSGSTATVGIHQDKPVVYSDCDAGTLGQFLQQTAGGTSCDDAGIFCGTGQVAPCKPTVGLGHLYTKTDTCALAGVPGDSSLSGSPLPTVSKAWTQNALSPDASGNATVALTLPHSTGNNQCTAAGVPDACCTGAGTGTCACSIGPCCQYLGGSASLAGSPESLSGYVQLPPLGASTAKAENVAASKATGKVRVTWSTSSELNLAVFKLLTHKKSGLVELTTVTPTGAGGGSRYALDIAMGDFQGGKDVVVRAVLNDGTFIDAAPVYF